MGLCIFFRRSGIIIKKCCSTLGRSAHTKRLPDWATPVARHAALYRQPRSFCSEQTLNCSYHCGQRRSYYCFTGMNLLHISGFRPCSVFVLDKIEINKGTPASRRKSTETVCHLPAAKVTLCQRKTTSKDRDFTHRQTFRRLSIKRNVNTPRQSDKKENASLSVKAKVWSYG